MAKKQLATKSLDDALRKHESTISMVLGAVVVLISAWMLFGYIRTFKARIAQNNAQPSPTPAVLETLPEDVKLVEVEGKKVPEGLPTTYVVQKGDSSWKVAEAFYGSGYNYVDIEKENNLRHNQYLEVGQKLTVPQAEVKKSTKVVQLSQEPVKEVKNAVKKYVVVKGDSLWKIAVAQYNNGDRWVDIYSANKNIVKNPGVLYVGMVLQLP